MALALHGQPLVEMNKIILGSHNLSDTGHVANVIHQHIADITPHHEVHAFVRSLPLADNIAKTKWFHFWHSPDLSQGHKTNAGGSLVVIRAAVNPDGKVADIQIGRFKASVSFNTPTTAVIMKSSKRDLGLFKRTKFSTEYHPRGLNGEEIQWVMALLRSAVENSLEFKQF